MVRKGPQVLPPPLNPLQALETLSGSEPPYLQLPASPTAIISMQIPQGWPKPQTLCVEPRASSQVTKVLRLSLLSALARSWKSLLRSPPKPFSHTPTPGCAIPCLEAVENFRSYLRDQIDLLRVFLFPAATLYPSTVIREVLPKKPLVLAREALELQCSVGSGFHIAQRQ